MREETVVRGSVATGSWTFFESRLVIFAVSESAEGGSGGVCRMPEIRRGNRCRVASIWQMKCGNCEAGSIGATENTDF